MKEKFKLYLQKNLSVFVFYAILFIFFISLCGFTTTVGIIVFFGAYSSSMTANRYGRIKLRRLERDGGLTFGKHMLFSHLALCPTYFIWILAAIVSFDSSGAWMAISLPIVAISILQVSLLLDLYWTKNQRYLFWISQIIAYVACFFIGHGLAKLV
jgi:hypothetical protein